jgi:D-alanine transaminase
MTVENPTVYLNGEFLPLDQAKVSVLDRGFLFGDGVYEVIPVYGGRMLRWEEHWRRLQNSLDGIRLASPLQRDALEAILNRLIIAGGHDQYIYLQVTRGAPPKRDHAFPADCPPTVFAMCSPIAPFPKNDGVRAVTVEDIRWKWCHIKAITLLGNILMRQQAVDMGCAEAILVRNGRITEGAASNVFAVLKGSLVTPPQGPELLPGITRNMVLELARDNGILYREAPLTLADMERAEEIWLTSSTREILPVIELDGRAVGSGCPGPVWRQLDALYQEYKQGLRERA